MIPIKFVLRLSDAEFTALSRFFLPRFEFVCLQILAQKNYVSINVFRGMSNLTLLKTWQRCRELKNSIKLLRWDFSGTISLYLHVTLANINEMISVGSRERTTQSGWLLTANHALSSARRDRRLTWRENDPLVLRARKERNIEILWFRREYKFVFVSIQDKTFVNSNFCLRILLMNSPNHTSCNKYFRVLWQKNRLYFLLIFSRATRLP